jgi:Uncharacterized Fe-S protein
MFLSEINIYPVKSLKGISVEKARIERRGLKFDRRWMLVDEENRFLTQRQYPVMATIATAIDGECLRVSHEGNDLEIPFLPAAEKEAKVEIWSSKVKAKVYEDSINRWFSEILQTKCRLVLMPEETRRKVDYFYAAKIDDHVSFADGYPFLLIGESSLNDLNSRLEKKVPMNRFRPNFVVSGAEPFAEDGWKKIRIGAGIFHVVKPCARCVMTTIEQTTGVKNGAEPLKTLADFRIPKGSLKKKILFGQNLIAEGEGENLRVGDRVEVLETKPKPRFS